MAVGLPRPGARAKRIPASDRSVKNGRRKRKTKRQTGWSVRTFWGIVGDRPDTGLCPAQVVLYWPRSHPQSAPVGVFRMDGDVWSGWARRAPAGTGRSGVGMLWTNTPASRLHHPSGPYAAVTSESCRGGGVCLSLSRWWEIGRLEGALERGVERLQEALAAIACRAWAASGTTDRNCSRGSGGPGWPQPA